MKSNSRLVLQPRRISGHSCQAPTLNDEEEYWGESESKTCSELKQPRFHGLTTEMLLVFKWRNPGVALEWPLCTKCDFTPKGASGLQTESCCPFTLRNSETAHKHSHKRKQTGETFVPRVFSVSHSRTHTEHWHKPSLKTLFVVSADFPLCMPPCRRLYVVIGNIWGADFCTVTEPIQWHQGDCHLGKPIIWISLKPINIRKRILCGLQNSFTNISCPNDMQSLKECITLTAGGPWYRTWFLWNVISKEIKFQIQSFVTFYQDYLQVFHKQNVRYI